MIGFEYLLLLILTFAGAVVMMSTYSRDHFCKPDDRSKARVIPGAHLEWDSSFRGDVAGERSRFELTVSVKATASNKEAVRIDKMQLKHTTPRPRGEGPDAETSTSDLPLELKPGSDRSIIVKGRSSLKNTGRYRKANLHLRATGYGVESYHPFTLGINIHLRDTKPSRGKTKKKPGKIPPWAGKPPSWKGGPPPWVK